MALSKKEEQRVTAKVFGWLSVVVALVLLAGGVGSWKAGAATVDMVNKGLVEQKIQFPPAGTPTFNPQAFPDAQKYAGKQVTDGMLAKAFAEDFLAVQIKLLGEGKTLSEVSAQVAMDRQNMMLQQKQGTMFQLETSRGMLMSAYGAWAQGSMMSTMGTVVLVGGAVLLLFGVAQLMRYKKLQ